MQAKNSRFGATTYLICLRGFQFVKIAIEGAWASRNIREISRYLVCVVSGECLAELGQLCAQHSPL